MLLCYFYKRFLSKNMGVFPEKEIRGISEVQGLESHDGETERVKGKVLEVK